MKKTLFVFCIEQISADVERSLRGEPGFLHNTEHVSEKNVSPILGEVLSTIKRDGHKVVLLSHKPYSEFTNKEMGFISVFFDQVLVGEKNINNIIFKGDNIIFISDDPEFLGRVASLGKIVGITSQDASYSDFSKEGAREFINGLAQLPSYLLQQTA